MLKPVFLLSAVLVAAAPSFADTTATPRIDQRQANQAQRINQGVESGALTGREATTLTARENHIAATEAAAKSDGKVTAAERAHLRGEERRTSRAIARKKHNARVAG